MILGRVIEARSILVRPAKNKPCTTNCLNCGPTRGMPRPNSRSSARRYRVIGVASQPGCQACHGSSRGHVQHSDDTAARPVPDFVFSGVNKSSAEVQSRTCLNCHKSGKRSHWPGSAHPGNVTAFPDLIAHSDNINLNARYTVDRQSTARLSYFYRRLDSADWAYQQVGSATLTNVIGTNEVPAHFAVHGVGVSYIRSFR